MSREQAVPQVKRIVINVSKVIVTFPVPGDDIPGAQAAQRKHLGGIARVYQATTDKPSGPRFPVGWWHPAWNGKAPAPLVWLAPNAA